MTGNVWIHRWSPPLSWPRTLLLCGVFVMAVAAIVFAPLLALCGLLIERHP